MRAHILAQKRGKLQIKMSDRAVHCKVVNQNRGENEKRQKNGEIKMFVFQCRAVEIPKVKKRNRQNNRARVFRKQSEPERGTPENEVKSLMFCFDEKVQSQQSEK